jgi:clan AA aspartic protease
MDVDVAGPGPKTEKVQAVIDTGYNGALTLPSSTVTALGLARLPSGIVRLGDHSRRVLDFFCAEILWLGQPRVVRVLCVEGDPLVGTALLDGHVLEAEFRPGGAVFIKPLP